MAVRIDVRPSPRTRAARGGDALAFLGRVTHALAWVLVLAGSDLLIALAVDQEHGRVAGTAVFALLGGSIFAGFASWCVREINRPSTVTVKETLDA